MYKIIIKNQDNSEIQSYQCKNINETVKIGSNPNSTIQIKNPTISGDHCLLEITQSNIQIKNLKARTGIFINESRLKKEKAVINDSDQIKIGDLFIELQKDLNEADHTPQKKNKVFTLFNLLFVLLLVPLIYLISKPEEIKTIQIGKIQSIKQLDEYKQNENSKNRTLQVVLSQAKDKYFEDKIFESAKLFKEALSIEKNNYEAKQYLKQINDELVPKLEKQVQKYIEERNIVNCAKACEKLKNFSPNSPLVKEATNFLEGHKQFENILELYKQHKFKQAEATIQKIIIVDEETLNEWKEKINKEVNITSLFKKILEEYKTKPTNKTKKQFQDFRSFETEQQILKETAKQKIKIYKNFKKFEKLSRSDPLDQAFFGINLFYQLTINEDQYIYNQVKSKLENLKKTCGPGTDMYTLLETETDSNIEQARSYKEINEIEFALSNYQKAIRGLRIISFYTNQDKYRKLEKEIYSEQQNYRNYLKIKAKKAQNSNNYKESDKINALLKKYKSTSFKQKIITKENENNKGDDFELLRKIFNEK